MAFGFLRKHFKRKSKPSLGSNEDRDSWVEKEFSKKKAQQLIVALENSKHKTLESLIAIQYHQPGEDLTEVFSRPKNANKEEHLLIQLLEKQRIKNDLAWELILKIRDAWVPISWWQKRGYHCSFDYLESIHPTQYVGVRGCYCVDHNPDTYREIRTRHASKEAYVAHLAEIDPDSISTTKDSKLHIEQYLGGSAWNLPHAGLDVYVPQRWRQAEDRIVGNTRTHGPTERS